MALCEYRGICDVFSSSFCNISWTYSIFVRRLSGKILRLDVRMYDTVESVMAQIIECSNTAGELTPL